jgi:hypothetical protein
MITPGWIVAFIIVFVILFFVIILIIIVKKRKNHDTTPEPPIPIPSPSPNPIRPPIIVSPPIVLPPNIPITPIPNGTVTLTPSSGDIVFAANPQNGNIMLVIPASALYTVGSKIRIFNTALKSSTSGVINVIAGAGTTINIRATPSVSTSVIRTFMPVTGTLTVNPGDELTLLVVNKSNTPSTTFNVVFRVDPTFYVFTGIAGPVQAAELVSSSTANGTAIQYIVGNTFVFLDPVTSTQYSAPVTISNGTFTFVNQNGNTVQITV